MKFPTRHKSGAKTRPAFTFIDLFAGIGGIGGMRLGFEHAGGKCVFTSEWDKFAQQTYRSNFDCSNHALAGDISKIPADAIPPHDILIGGFPCQPFSLMGIGTKNKLGQKHGFEDKTQGTLFFDIARIIKHHQPKAFFLENVKNLLHHDKGKTFQTIINTLEKELGYNVQYRVINAKGLVPQSRNRVYIIGFKDKNNFDFSKFKIKYPKETPVLGDILIPQRDVPKEFTLSDTSLVAVKKQQERNIRNGNGFRTKYLGPKDTTPTLVAGYSSSRDFYIKQRGKNPRKITPKECARLMGFPDNFKIEVSNTQAWKQFGNSVAVPLIVQLAKVIKPFILASKEKHVYNFMYENKRKKDSCSGIFVPATSTPDTISPPSK